MDIKVNGIKEEEISHFAQYFPKINGLVKANPYKKESKHERNILETESSLLDAGKINSKNLHKFEKKFKTYPIFRSGLGVDGNKKNKVIIYTLIKDKENYKVLLLRLVNHDKWIDILDDKKEFKSLISEINNNLNI
ncbi:hypothetical protein CL617_01535 [archaeon]|nr:hypothetical protein [archaeon]|tara:strand:- start:5375 stop:5782 length:408 start_codon:yes stop_codon:yes gene_type:complete